MERRQGILVTREFFQFLFPILFASRIFGLCPISYKRKGNNILLMWSTKYCIYSYALAIILGSLTAYGIIHDMQMAKVNESIRMSSDKGKYITVCDMSIVILTVWVIIFLLPITFKKFWKTIDCLNKVDMIAPPKDIRTDRQVSIALMIITTVLFIYIASFDIYNWNQKSTARNSLLKDYASFYILYFIILTQELYYCHLLISIKQRCKTLNFILWDYIFQSNNVAYQMDKFFGITVVEREKNKGVTPMRLNNDMKPDEFFNKGMTPYNIQNLARIYELVCNAADNVNSCCGISILLVMMSCLLHLIVTPYFFIIEVHSGHNLEFAVLQFSWIIIHALRLLIIVEPCQACLSENQKTISLIFKLLTHSKREIRPQLGILAMQLFSCKFEFTLCGLVTINRSIITAIAGAVTTYMVILFQFKPD